MSKVCLSKCLFGRSAISARLIAAILATGLYAALLSNEAIADDAVDDLSSQATDPTASLMSFNFIGAYTGSFHGPNNGEPDHALDLTFRPVIPFTAFGKPNILRMTLPYHANGRGDKGLDSVSLFDLVILNRSWGRLAVGGVATLANESAADTFVIGPAVGAIWALSRKTKLGLFNQNVFGGDTAVSQFQPIAAYQLGNGWSVSAGDLQFTYDWKRSKWINVPIGFQVGKVTRIGNQPVRWAINPQYNLKNDDGLAKWKLVFTFTLLVPTG